jgi:protein TonB
MFLAAPPGERLFERPQPPISAAKRRFAFVLLICFLLHAIPISIFAYLDGSDEPAPGVEEVPVEMMVEPPPQKEPDPPEAKKEPEKSEQQPRQATLDEKVATDAPRAPNDEKVIKDAKDEVSQSPKAEPDKEPVKTRPADGTALTLEDTKNSKPAEAAAAQVMDHRDDGEPVAAAEAQQPDTAARLKAALQPQAQQNAAQNPLSAFAALPDYSFAPASRHATTAVGKAASTYLSILYGMVLPRLHAAEGAAGRAQTMGEIIFNVDLSGRLVRARVVASSGSPELDAAAMAAIRAAAPFPPPPTGGGLSLTLRYGK